MGIITWFHNKKFHKVKKELLSKTLKEWTDEHGCQHKLIVNDYFKLVFVADSENSDCDKIMLYWRNFENSFEWSLGLAKYFNQDAIGWHYCNFSPHKITQYIFEDIEKHFKRFDRIKNQLIRYPYLQNYRIYAQDSCNSKDGYTTKVHLTPYIFAKYINDIKEQYKSSKDFTEDIINKYKTNCLEVFAHYKRINADEPDIEVYTIESWYNDIYKPSIDLEERNKECQATIDEINKIKDNKKQEKV